MCARACVCVCMCVFEIVLVCQSVRVPVWDLGCMGGRGNCINVY